MKKSNKSIGVLIVICVIASSFIWFFQNVGLAGIGIVCIIFVASAVFYWSSKNRKDQNDFDEIALYVFRNRSHPDEEKKINRALAKNNPNKSILVRNIQILRETIYLAVNSKNRDTAQYNYNILPEVYGRVQSEYRGLVSTQVIEVLDSAYNDTIKRFHTAFYLNMAKGFIEKSVKLKTEKSKEKYRNLALEILSEGLSDELSNKEILNKNINKIKADSSSVGDSQE